MDLLIKFHTDKSHFMMTDDECLKLNLIDVSNVMEYIRQIEEDRNCMKSEAENYKVQIKCLLSDLSILEDLYKNSFEEMVKQDNLITLLRQSYLDHREEEIHWETDNKLLQSKLNETNSMLDTALSVQEDVDDMKKQLHDLQTLLKTDDVTNYSILKTDKCKNKSCTKIVKRIPRFKNTSSRQKLLLKHYKAMNIQTNKHVEDLRQFLTDRFKNSSMDMDNSTSDKIIALEKELFDLKNSLKTLQTSLKESPYGSNVTNKYDELVKSNISMGEQVKKEHAAVLWLESELYESTTKGAEICCESKQIFGQIKNWLYLVKRERRGMQLKIKELRYINKMLLKGLNNNENSIQN